MPPADGKDPPEPPPVNPPPPELDPVPRPLEKPPILEKLVDPDPPEPVEVQPEPEPVGSAATISEETLGAGTVSARLTSFFELDFLLSDLF